MEVKNMLIIVFVVLLLISFLVFIFSLIKIASQLDRLEEEQKSKDLKEGEYNE